MRTIPCISILIGTCAIIVTYSHLIEKEKEENTCYKMKKLESRALKDNGEIDRCKTAIYLRFETTHKIAFLFGVIFGTFVLRHQVILETSKVIIFILFQMVLQELPTNISLTMQQVNLDTVFYRV